jgi:YafQ family addiction module toxin component
MHNFSFEEKLQKTLDKLFKKDKETFNIIKNKINEIINCENLDHYKNLRSPLQEFKRVHIKKSFVLTFKYIKSGDKVVFYDFDHHDNIYK